MSKPEQYLCIVWIFWNSSSVFILSSLILRTVEKSNLISDQKSINTVIYFYNYVNNTFPLNYKIFNFYLKKY
jgi:hypothetical protein